MELLENEYLVDGAVMLIAAAATAVTTCRHSHPPPAAPDSLATCRFHFNELGNFNFLRDGAGWMVMGCICVGALPVSVCSAHLLLTTPASVLTTPAL